MNDMNQDDDELRRMLRDLGRDAESRAPSLQRVWRAARESMAVRTPDPWQARMRWALASAVAIAAGLMAFWMTAHRDTEVVVPSQNDLTLQAESEAMDAFDSETPTDFLLTGNGGSVTPSVAQLTREINALLSR